MDDNTTRRRVQEHADSVARGDLGAATADFVEDMRPHVPEIASALPLPVSSAEVLSVEVGDEESVARIRYTGESGTVTIKSQWRDVNGRPEIFAGEPVD
jgi:hypothetical protein